MSSQYGELRPTSGWDPLASLGHPCKFQRVSRLGIVTARHFSSGRQPNVAALNRGRHLYSAERPSRWALAHILVLSAVSIHLWHAPLWATFPVEFALPSKTLRRRKLRLPAVDKREDYQKRLRAELCTTVVHSTHMSVLRDDCCLSGIVWVFVSFVRLFLVSDTLHGPHFTFTASWQSVIFAVKATGGVFGFSPKLRIGSISA